MPRLARIVVALAFVAGMGTAVLRQVSPATGSQYAPRETPSRLRSGLQAGLQERTSSARNPGHNHSSFVLADQQPRYSEAEGRGFL